MTELAADEMSAINACGLAFGPVFRATTVPASVPSEIPIAA